MFSLGRNLGSLETSCRQTARTSSAVYSAIMTYQSVIVALSIFYATYIYIYILWGFVSHWTTILLRKYSRTSYLPHYVNHTYLFVPFPVKCVCRQFDSKRYYIWTYLMVFSFTKAIKFYTGNYIVKFEGNLLYMYLMDAYEIIQRLYHLYFM